jgi:hypothetical protein
MSNYSPKTFSNVKINVEAESVKTMSEVEAMLTKNTIIKNK